MAARRRRGAWSVPALLLLCACSSAPPPYRLEWLLFGSPATLELRGLQPEAAEAAAARVASALAPLHRAWHPWEDGDLTRFNRALAAGGAVAVPPLLARPLERARALQASSGGLFDPATGGLVRLWGFHTSEFPLRSPPPTDALVDAWRADPARLDDLEPLPGGRVRSHHGALSLDFNAIAEGLAAEQAATELRRLGVRDALLSLGGDVLAMGQADGRAWQVGVRDPHGTVLGGIAMRGTEALFSSGNYHKFRAGEDGTRWPHVLDPRTGRPAIGTAGTAVLHPDPVLADAAATALLVAGAAGFEALTRRMRTPCALLLGDDDTLLLTPLMRERLALLRTPARVRVVGPGASSCGSH